MNKELARVNWLHKMKVNVIRAQQADEKYEVVMAHLAELVKGTPHLTVSEFLCHAAKVYELGDFARGEYQPKHHLDLFHPVKEDYQNYHCGFVWFQTNDEEDDEEVRDEMYSDPNPYEERALVCGLLLAMLEEGDLDE